MELVLLNSIFKIEYGNQLNLNAMELSSAGVNFVSRSSQNLGVAAVVKELNTVKPYNPGLITVTLGGTYLLSSFIQPEPFYTAQNIKVLSPKSEMSFSQKVFYCLCISKNRFRYSSHGREANKSLDKMLVPSLKRLPSWANNHSQAEIDRSSAKTGTLNISKYKKRKFKLNELFNIERGQGARKSDIVKNGMTPFITSTERNNGLTGYVNNAPYHQGNVISVNRNGSVAEAFFQEKPFCSTEDVHVFSPKFKMNIFHAMYLIPILRAEKFRYTFGRKWGIERMKNTWILLPMLGNGEPAWDEIEKYIMTLPYSKNLT
ncbi:MAG: restriction endonuclease subunit S [Desulfobacula sp.]|nr:restriction endonuclease subunit S [Desulfobacula sp.]